MGSDSLYYDEVTVGKDFNPRSPHGERPSQWRYEPGGIRISIHAPAWGAIRYCYQGGRQYGFQSTLPAWGATIDSVFFVSYIGISIHAPRMGSDKHFLHACAVVAHISIHAPRMGSDVSCECISARQAYFNPRSRMGSDFSEINCSSSPITFQSTPPHGERHIKQTNNNTMFHISIHAPAWGATSHDMITDSLSKFQSTPPHGERHFRWRHFIAKLIISIHAPAWGATCHIASYISARLISIHAPAWGATSWERSEC